MSSDVDHRVVVNPEQARSLLTAVSHVGGFRPVEVVGPAEV
ncbi:hypothetical protein ACFRSX_10320 [Streptomyces goshikiensis]|nr:hypothetical protein [Streptomyces sp. CB02120-2]